MAGAPSSAEASPFVVAGSGPHGAASLSVSVFVVDHEMAVPDANLGDPVASGFAGLLTDTEAQQHLSDAEQRLLYRQLANVPVLRVFGRDASGVRCQVRVHGQLPYLYFPWPTAPAWPEITDRVGVAKKLLQITLALEAHPLVKDFKDRAPNRTTAAAASIYSAHLVRGYDFYGYHTHPQCFVKLVVVNPFKLATVATVLGSTLHVMGMQYQPYDAHFAYVMQAMLDLGLTGMGGIHVRDLNYDSRTDPAARNAPMKPGFAGPHGVEVDVHVTGVVNRRYHDGRRRLDQSALRVEKRFIASTLNDVWEDLAEYKDGLARERQEGLAGGVDADAKAGTGGGQKRDTVNGVRTRPHNDDHSVIGISGSESSVAAAVAGGVPLTSQAAAPAGSGSGGGGGTGVFAATPPDAPSHTHTHSPRSPFDSREGSAAGTVGVSQHHGHGGSRGGEGTQQPTVEDTTSGGGGGGGRVFGSSTTAGEMRTTNRSQKGPEGGSSLSSSCPAARDGSGRPSHGASARATGATSPPHEHPTPTGGAVGSQMRPNLPEEGVIERMFRQALSQAGRADPTQPPPPPPPVAAAGCEQHAAVALLPWVTAPVDFLVRERLGLASLLNKTTRNTASPFRCVTPTRAAAAAASAPTSPQPVRLTFSSTLAGGSQGREGVLGGAGPAEGADDDLQLTLLALQRLRGAGEASQGLDDDARGAGREIHGGSASAGGHPATNANGDAGAGVAGGGDAPPDTHDGDIFDDMNALVSGAAAGLPRWSTQRGRAGVVDEEDGEGRLRDARGDSASEDGEDENDDDDDDDMAYELDSCGAGGGRGGWDDDDDDNDEDGDRSMMPSIDSTLDGGLSWGRPRPNRHKTPAADLGDVYTCSTPHVDAGTPTTRTGASGAPARRAVATHPPHVNTDPAGALEINSDANGRSLRTRSPHPLGRVWSARHGLHVASAPAGIDAVVDGGAGKRHRTAAGDERSGRFAGARGDGRPAKRARRGEGGDQLREALAPDMDTAQAATDAPDAMSSQRSYVPMTPPDDMPQAGDPAGVVRRVREVLCTPPEALLPREAAAGAAAAAGGADNHAPAQHAREVVTTPLDACGRDSEDEAVPAHERVVPAAQRGAMHESVDGPARPAPMEVVGDAVRTPPDVCVSEPPTDGDEGAPGEAAAAAAAAASTEASIGVDVAHDLSGPMDVPPADLGVDLNRHVRAPPAAAAGAGCDDGGGDGSSSSSSSSSNSSPRGHPQQPLPRRRRRLPLLSGRAAAAAMDDSAVPAGEEGSESGSPPADAAVEALKGGRKGNNGDDDDDDGGDGSGSNVSSAPSDTDTAAGMEKPTRPTRAVPPSQRRRRPRVSIVASPVRQPAAGGDGTDNDDASAGSSGGEGSQNHAFPPSLPRRRPWRRPVAVDSPVSEGGAAPTAVPAAGAAELELEHSFLSDGDATPIGGDGERERQGGTGSASGGEGQQRQVSSHDPHSHDPPRRRRRRRARISIRSPAEGALLPVDDEGAAAVTMLPLPGVPPDPEGEVVSQVYDDDTNDNSGGGGGGGATGNSLEMDESGGDNTQSEPQSHLDDGGDAASCACLSDASLANEDGDGNGDRASPPQHHVNVNPTTAHATQPPPSSMPLVHATVVQHGGGDRLVGDTSQTCGVYENEDSEGRSRDGGDEPRSGRSGVPHTPSQCVPMIRPTALATARSRSSAGSRSSDATEPRVLDTPSQSGVPIAQATAAAGGGWVSCTPDDASASKEERGDAVRQTPPLSVRAVAAGGQGRNGDDGSDHNALVEAECAVHATPPLSVPMVRATAAEGPPPRAPDAATLNGSAEEMRGPTSVHHTPSLSVPMVRATVVGGVDDAAAASDGHVDHEDSAAPDAVCATPSLLVPMVRGTAAALDERACTPDTNRDRRGASGTPLSGEGAACTEEEDAVPGTPLLSIPMVRATAAAAASARASTTTVRHRDEDSASDVESNARVDNTPRDAVRGTPSLSLPMVRATAAGMRESAAAADGDDGPHAVCATPALSVPMVRATAAVATHASGARGTVVDEGVQATPPLSVPMVRATVVDERGVDCERSASADRREQEAVRETPADSVPMVRATAVARGIRSPTATPSQDLEPTTRVLATAVAGNAGSDSLAARSNEDAGSSDNGDDDVRMGDEDDTTAGARDMSAVPILHTPVRGAVRRDGDLDDDNTTDHAARDQHPNVAERMRGTPVARSDGSNGGDVEMADADADADAYDTNAAGGERAVQEIVAAVPIDFAAAQGAAGPQRRAGDEEGRPRTLDVAGALALSAPVVAGAGSRTAAAAAAVAATTVCSGARHGDHHHDHHHRHRRAGVKGKAREARERHEDQVERVEDTPREHLLRHDPRYVVAGPVRVVLETPAGEVAAAAAGCAGNSDPTRAARLGVARAPAASSRTPDSPLQQTTTGNWGPASSHALDVSPPLSAAAVVLATPEPLMPPALPSVGPLHGSAGDADPGSPLEAVPGMVLTLTPEGGGEGGGVASAAAAAVSSGATGSSPAIPNTPLDDLTGMMDQRALSDAAGVEGEGGVEAGVDGARPLSTSTPVGGRGRGRRVHVSLQPCTPVATPQRGSGVDGTAGVSTGPRGVGSTARISRSGAFSSGPKMFVPFDMLVGDDASPEGGAPPSAAVAREDLNDPPEPPHLTMATPQPAAKDDFGTSSRNCNRHAPSASSDVRTAEPSNGRRGPGALAPNTAATTATRSPSLGGRDAHEDAAAALAAVVPATQTSSVSEMRVESDDGSGDGAVVPATPGVGPAPDVGLDDVGGGGADADAADGMTDTQDSTMAPTTPTTGPFGNSAAAHTRTTLDGGDSGIPCAAGIAASAPVSMVPSTPQSALHGGEEPPGAVVRDVPSVLDGYGCIRSGSKSLDEVALPTPEREPHPLAYETPHGTGPDGRPREDDAAGGGRDAYDDGYAPETVLRLSQACGSSASGDGGSRRDASATAFRQPVLVRSESEGGDDDDDDDADTATGSADLSVVVPQQVVYCMTHSTSTSTVGERERADTGINPTGHESERRAPASRTDSSGSVDLIADGRSGRKRGWDAVAECSGASSCEARDAAAGHPPRRERAQTQEGSFSTPPPPSHAAAGARGSQPQRKKRRLDHVDDPHAQLTTTDIDGGPEVRNYDDHHDPCAPDGAGSSFSVEGEMGDAGGTASRSSSATAQGTRIMPRQRHGGRDSPGYAPAPQGVARGAVNVLVLAHDDEDDDDDGVDVSNNPTELLPVTPDGDDANDLVPPPAKRLRKHESSSSASVLPYQPSSILPMVVPVGGGAGGLDATAATAATDDSDGADGRGTSDVLNTRVKAAHPGGGGVGGEEDRGRVGKGTSLVQTGAGCTAASVAGAALTADDDDDDVDSINCSVLPFAPLPATGSTTGARAMPPSTAGTTARTSAQMCGHDPAGAAAAETVSNGLTLPTQVDVDATTTPGGAVVDANAVVSNTLEPQISCVVVSESDELGGGARGRSGVCITVSDFPPTRREGSEGVVEPMGTAEAGDAGSVICVDGKRPRVAHVYTPVLPPPRMMELIASEHPLQPIICQPPERVKSVLNNAAAAGYLADTPAVSGFDNTNTGTTAAAMPPPAPAAPHPTGSVATAGSSFPMPPPQQPAVFAPPRRAVAGRGGEGGSGREARRYVYQSLRRVPTAADLEGSPLCRPARGAAATAEGRGGDAGPRTAGGASPHEPAGAGRGEGGELPSAASGTDPTPSPGEDPAAFNFVREGARRGVEAAAATRGPTRSSAPHSVAFKSTTSSAGEDTAATASATGTGATTAGKEGTPDARRDSNRDAKHAATATASADHVHALSDSMPPPNTVERGGVTPGRGAVGAHGLSLLTNVTGGGMSVASDSPAKAMHVAKNAKGVGGKQQQQQAHAARRPQPAVAAETPVAGADATGANTPGPRATSDSKRSGKSGGSGSAGGDGGLPMLVVAGLEVLPTVGGNKQAPRASTPDPLHDPLMMVAVVTHSCRDMTHRGNDRRHLIAVAVDSSGPQNQDAFYLPIAPTPQLAVQFVPTEKALVLEAVKLLQEADPDVLLGWDTARFSFGYLSKRAAYHGIDLGHLLGRARPTHERAAKPVAARVGKGDEVYEFETGSGAVVGRVAVEMWRALRHELKLTSYTLCRVAKAALGRTIPYYDHVTLAAWARGLATHGRGGRAAAGGGRSPGRAAGRSPPPPPQQQPLPRPPSTTPPHVSGKLRGRAAEYLLEKVCVALEIAGHLDLFNRGTQMARIYGIQFADVFTRGSQFKVENMFVRLAKPIGYVMLSPSRVQVRHQNHQEGVPLVMEPRSGFYTDPVAVLDFRSLYPSIVIAYNICYSTCIGKINAKTRSKKLGTARYRAPVVDSRKLFISPNSCGFVSKDVRTGVLPRVLAEILTTRFGVQAVLKEAKAAGDAPMQAILHARQLGLKMLANVTYGYASATFTGRMPCSDVADAIVLTARHTVERLIRDVNAHPTWNARVVYGDTDSIFVSFPGASRERAFEVGKEIVAHATAANPSPVKLKLEKVYSPCFLVTKKRYGGWAYESPGATEPVFDAKGLECIRRDQCRSTQKIQENALKTLFAKGDMEDTKAYVLRQFTKILAGEVNPAELMIQQEVKFGSYANPEQLPPAAKVARDAMKQEASTLGAPLYRERVPYLVVNSPAERLTDKLVHPSSLLGPRATGATAAINYNYYITKQIAPALERVIGLAGAEVMEWVTSMPRPRVKGTDGPRDAGVPGGGVGVGGGAGAGVASGMPLAPAGFGTVNTARQKNTLHNYYASALCAACRAPLPQGESDSVYCVSCRHAPHHARFLLAQRAREAQRQVAAVNDTCARCANSHDPTVYRACWSLDCDVPWRRQQADVALRKAQACLLEW